MRQRTMRRQGVETQVFGRQKEREEEEEEEGQLEQSASTHLLSTHSLTHHPTTPPVHVATWTASIDRF